MTEGSPSVLLGTILVAAAGIALLAGCAAAGSERRVELLRVDIPLGEPTWVPKNAMLAVSEDRKRVVRVDVGEATGSRAPVRSEKISDAGEGLALSPEEPGRAYLARPESGGISALDTDTLRVIDGYEVGGSPGYVTLDKQPEILFALSEDGSAVSSVDLETSETMPAVEVGGTPQTLVEAPEKGADPAFWASGPGGVAFYGGDPLERLVGKKIASKDIAVDDESSQRAYVTDGDRVVALEGDPQGFLRGKLEVVATHNLGGKVEQVASDELYVYAATRDRLVTMRRETLDPVDTVEFGPILVRKGVSPEGVSGIGTGTGADDVYLTFEGAPYMLSARKP